MLHYIKNTCNNDIIVFYHNNDVLYLTSKFIAILVFFNIIICPWFSVRVSILVPIVSGITTKETITVSGLLSDILIQYVLELYELILYFA